MNKFLETVIIRFQYIDLQKLLKRSSVTLSITIYTEPRKLVQILTKRKMKSMKKISIAGYPKLFISNVITNFEKSKQTDINRNKDNPFNRLPY